MSLFAASTGAKHVYAVRLAFFSCSYLHSLVLVTLG